MGAIEADGISQILIPMPTTKIASDLWSRALLVSLFRPIKSANATQLGGRPRQVLCAHCWRPDQLRSELRLCELRLVDLWLGSWDQPVVSRLGGLCPED